MMVSKPDIFKKLQRYSTVTIQHAFGSSTGGKEGAPVRLEGVIRLKARVAAGFFRSDVDCVVRVVQDGVH